MVIVTSTDPLYAARAVVLRDLAATRCDGPAEVSALEEAVSQRRWWVEQWPEGATYAAGLVAQDVQDALLETAGRWPLCPWCEEPDGGPATHALHVDPDLGGPDPVWVCEESATAVAPLGGLADLDGHELGGYGRREAG